ncbi:DUF4062 domain-containing protein [Corallococcus exiguus]|uniref:DUF4062 domain-containing protein n=1 Tax=Corallococcus exiguus TaxID=83462 RepID=UPI00155F621C|nr:DUF4062 domain-containing protein [Corallococcus exiguus]NRD45537.1 DUF4062 domain-containing protein [Corallococcus exiguus]
MHRKLQIFISSTYVDLIDERQAAVDAVLKSGHIPAGMELFAAGSKSQMETIKRWIDESDIYMLILGSRYGSIEPQSAKSYTHMEYEYALSVKKPLFAVVLSEAAIDKKVQVLGRRVVEAENPRDLKDFRSQVLSRVCRIVEDSRDIKLAIHESISELARRHIFKGWVSGERVEGFEDALRKLEGLQRENDELRGKLNKKESSSAKSHVGSKNGGLDRDRLERTLRSMKVSFKSDGKTSERSVLSWFYFHREAFVRGVDNSPQATVETLFMYNDVAPALAIYGLVEDEKVAGVRWRRFRTTRAGNEFLAYLVDSMSESTNPMLGLPPRARITVEQMAVKPSGMSSLGGSQGAVKTSSKADKKPKP